MQQDVKQHLIEALRSARYQQIPYQLRGDHERDMCALGVLDELHHRAGQGPRHHGERLPDAVLSWAGLSETGADKIAALNNSGLSFLELADLLERTPDEDDLPPPYAPAIIPLGPRPRPVGEAAEAGEPTVVRRRRELMPP